MMKYRSAWLIVVSVYTAWFTALFVYLAFFAPKSASCIPVDPPVVKNLFGIPSAFVFGVLLFRSVVAAWQWVLRLR